MNRNKKNVWLDGIMGVATGDALGLPVQFMRREELNQNPVTSMEGDNQFRTPAGTWSDDTSMTMAILGSMLEKEMIDPVDIMNQFEAWLYNAEYCALDTAIDIGTTCGMSIDRFHENKDIMKCGSTGEYANGNGSLMRTLPICIYYAKKVHGNETTVEEAVRKISIVSALTHNHPRACIGCCLYFFCVKSILFEEGDLKKKLQKGIYDGFTYYEKDMDMLEQATYYSRTLDIEKFAKTDIDMIKSSGYVVDSFEAAIWSLITTDSLKECLLKAVNLGDDADTVGAIAGGIAGLYYGYDSIPEEWLNKLAKREWLETMCRKAFKKFN